MFLRFDQEISFSRTTMFRIGRKQNIARAVTAFQRHAQYGKRLATQTQACLEEGPVRSKILGGNEEYRSFIDRLTESNVDKYVDLPTIAVMGDTSSGKSSLLSNLSLIELPSADELTTRCPIMLKMNRSDTQSATVRVVLKDVYPDATTFEPETFDESNWSELTASIARAQKHIVDISQKEVARDIVSVQISGPRCEALTLIDLPGIVRSTGKGESENLTGDIQSLIDDYLKNPRCVILAVHPSNVDFHNSQIMADARKVDPQTKRTIPVLTKPDLIDEGAEQGVLDLLLGLKTEKFEKGFHMVKGRSQASLNSNDTIESGLGMEESFFRNTLPWREVNDRNLFGTKNLRVKLSAILMQLICGTFPEIVEELTKERNDAFKKYSLLGDVPGTSAEKRIYYTHTKDELVKHLRPILLGGSLRLKQGPLTQSCAAEFHRLSKEFQIALHSTKLGNTTRIDVADNVVAIDEDNKEREGRVAFVSDDGIYLDFCFVPGAKGREPELPGQPIGSVSEKANIGAVMQISEEGDQKELYKFSKEKVSADSNWIRDLIIRNRTYSLPVFVNSELFDLIVSDSIDEQWKKPSIDLVERLSYKMKQALYSEVENNTRLQRFPKLQSFVKRKAVVVIEELSASTLHKVRDFIKSEKIPYSQDHYLFENITRMRSKRLKDELCQLLLSSSISDDDHYGRRGSTTIALSKMIDSVFERNQKKSVDDHMAEEMLHILDAYGKVALKRFCDTVPMICGEGLLHSFEDRFNQVLSTVTDEELEKLLHVPSEEETLRKVLKGKLETMDHAVSIFNDLF